VTEFHPFQPNAKIDRRRSGTGRKPAKKSTAATHRWEVKGGDDDEQPVGSAETTNQTPTFLFPSNTLRV